RHGLATSNLRWAIERCRERGLLAGLDATPDGVEVYRPLGFQEVCDLRRLRAEQPGALRLPRPDVAIRLLQAARDLDAIARLDARVFGADRRRLLAYLSRSEPHRALLAQAEGELAGFVLARPGRVALHIGPLVAHSPAVAALLLAQALTGSTGPVSIDVPDRQSDFQALLQSAGFEPVRPFTRMVQGAPEMLGDMTGCFAIAGPEFG
ncbi:MAG TPA: GNAT family N-acetyltransferase, partial [Geminicoccaceae bacterium]|nr:GNAT family N-acetyltransferase [Geminicoccaceae bacterium]